MTVKLCNSDSGVASHNKLMTSKAIAKQRVKPTLVGCTLYISGITIQQNIEKHKYLSTVHILTSHYLSFRQKYLGF